MNILQLGKFYPVLGGVEKVMTDLADGISARGVRCDVLTATAVPGPGSVEKVNDFCTRTLCRSYKKLAGTMIAPGMIWKLFRTCRNYDIIHIHHPDPMAALALLCSFYRGKVVLHWHSDIIKQKKMLKFYLPIQNWLVRRADVIVGTTPVYIKESSYLQKVQDKCTYVPIGVDQVHPDPVLVEKVKKQYPGKKLILSVGRHVYYKGFQYLVNMAKLLPDDWHILIAGEGELRDIRQNQIDILGIHDKVSLLGYVPYETLYTLFGACDIFCLSSVQKTEAFAIVQVEAMSCGKPIVATNIPGSGVPWVNHDGVSGLNVTIKNGQELADAVLEIIKPENYERYSRQALERYQTVFNKDAMIDRTLAIYTKLTEK